MLDRRFRRASWRRPRSWDPVRLRHPGCRPSPARPAAGRGPAAADLPHHARSMGVLCRRGEHGLALVRPWSQGNHAVQPDLWGGGRSPVQGAWAVGGGAPARGRGQLLRRTPDAAPHAATKPLPSRTPALRETLRLRRRGPVVGSGIPATHPPRV